MVCRPGEPDDHVEPDACQTDMNRIASSAVFGLPSQSGPWMPNFEQERVDQPVRLVHEQPQHRNDDHGGDHRQEVDGAEEVDPAIFTLTSSASTSANAACIGTTKIGEEDGVAQRLPEHRVAGTAG